MKLELRRVDPMRAANVGALVYGLLMGAFVLIIFPIFILAAVLTPSGGLGAFESLFALILLLLYPVFGLVMGWITGFLACGIYNVVIGWSGGLLLEFDQR